MKAAQLCPTGSNTRLKKHLGAGRTLMYDMTQKVDHAVSAYRPDLVILDEEKKTALLIDITCLMDINM
eukprot:7960199-Ditylum_brightwellii.AAC.1